MGKPSLFSNFRLALGFGLAMAMSLVVNNLPISVVRAQTHVPEDARIAFVREHNVWLRDANGERRLSHLVVLGQPQWSCDGRFVAFVGRTQVKHNRLGGTSGLADNFGLGHNDPETTVSRSGSVVIEVVDAETGAKKIVMRQAYPVTVRFQWARTGHKLAYQRNHQLNLADFDKQGTIKHGVAEGVSDFAWLPDSSGFLVAADAHQLPDGWTNALIYKLLVPNSSNSRKAAFNTSASASVDLRSGPHVFFRLPKVLSTNNMNTNNNSMSVTGIRGMKWSKDGHYVAFTARTTRHSGQDGDRLCVLSQDASKFRVVGPMLANKDWYSWSPSANTIGFIRGTVPDVTRGKKLTIAAAPRFTPRNLAPMGAADDGFCWIDATHIIVSRHQEALPSKSPIQLESSLFPVLFNIDVERPTIQNRITSPPEGVGDYEPHVLGWQQVLWTRAPAGTDKAEVWFGKADGTEVRLWVQDAVGGQYAIYTG